MITINSPDEARSLVDLAVEIQAGDPRLTWREAIHYACAELPVVLADVQADATFKPAKVVWFDPWGQPTRIPNLMNAEELVDFTGGFRDS